MTARDQARALRLLDEVLDVHQILQAIYGELPALVKLDQRIRKLTKKEQQNG